MPGPLAGLRVIEIAGIGPGPFAAMLLSDLGAEVIRVERAGAVRGSTPDKPAGDVSLRGRRNIAIDLKHPDGVATLLNLVTSAEPLDMTSTTSRSPARWHTSDVPVKRRFRRSTWWAISAEAACSLRWV